jgi:hypothetical protein
VGRLVFDGFPRTGNSFLANSLRLAFPQYELDWGRHRIATFKTEKVITSVRNPVNSIASSIKFFNVPIDKIDDYINWYDRFLTGTLKYFDSIYAVKFEDLTTNPFNVLQGYADKFNLQNPKSITVEQVINLTKETHSEHLPKGNNNFIKEKVLESKHINNSLRLYEEITKKIEGNSSD